MKKSSTFLVIKECKETTVSYRFVPVRMTIIEKIIEGKNTEARHLHTVFKDGIAV